MSLLAAADPSTMASVTDTVTGNSSNLGPILVGVLGAAIAVSAVILGVKKGWKLFSGAIKGA